MRYDWNPDPGRGCPLAVLGCGVIQLGDGEAGGSHRPLGDL